MQASRERFTTTRSIQVQLATVHKLETSTEAVRRHFTEHNLLPRILATSPVVTLEHHKARLQFAREHVNIDDWKRVLFTNDSRFCLYSSDRRTGNFRRLNDRYVQCNIR
ncbi:HTH Tnp Tc3 2 domain containing protein [Asbolus verrucosus]|uniref:HTH Tnp Tc3 2 domain containing protein n=1 Tax=Asbolus verrucosus TaxID=1661398 RepID=A0A482VCN5_ASBVE|nr:HTH Tnp Tc3 2 domain containing protein [Asbolus verrucosus]